jgi:hypothetical protein
MATTEVMYYDQALKTVYSNEAMFEYVVKPVATLNELERTANFTVTQPAGATLITVPVMTGLAQGYNTTDEYGPLPTAGRSTIQQATYYSKQHTATFRFSFRAKNAGSDPDSGWKSIPAIEMDSVIQSLRQSINRQIFGDGTGKLATCSAASSTNTIPVDTTRWIYAHATNGMYVDIIETSNGSTVASQRQVTAKTATSITISGTAITTTNTCIVVNSGSYNAEMLGLSAIVSTQALGGIDPSVAGFEEWSPAGFVAGATNSSGAFDAAGATPNLSLFQKVFTSVEDNSGKIDFIVASTGVQTAAANYLTSFKRIPVQSNPITLPGGFEGIDWNGVPLGRDKDCPSGTAYFIEKSGLKICEVIPPGWQDLGGGIIHWDGARGYQAVWIWDMQLCAFARNRLAKMINIGEA